MDKIDRDLLAEEMRDKRKMDARDDFIAERRLNSLVEDKFEDTGLVGDVTTRFERGVGVVEPDRYLDDDEFDIFRETAMRFTSYQRTFKGGRNTVRPDRVERDLPPDPVDVHESRSEYAQKQDIARSAELTNDPELYAKYPNRYDWPLVDTPEGIRASQKETIGGLRNLF